MKKSPLTGIQCKAVLQSISKTKETGVYNTSGKNLHSLQGKTGLTKGVIDKVINILLEKNLISIRAVCGCVMIKRTTDKFYELIED